jgi:hypothetical protein
MADYDSSIIKPVKGLQNIAGLTPAKRREERKRRQQLPKENKEEREQEMGQSVDESNLDNTPQGRTENENGRDPDSIGIDYCA